MTDDRPDTGFATRAVREDPPATGDVVPPIHLSSTYAMASPGEPMAEDKYARLGNPTRRRLEERLADLEGGTDATAYASGMAAIAAVCFTVLEPGAHVVAFDSLYGGTRVLFDDLLAQWGVDVDYVDARDPAAVSDACREETALLWMETPTNPLLRLCDLRAMADVAAATDALLAVDNTFASPALQRPLEHGADVVTHSTTKFLNGHSDSVGGAAVVADPDLAERLRHVHHYDLAATMAPFDAFLVSRGIKTLAPRMERHCANARAVAEFLADHPRVETVNYPGLASHPQHDLAGEQMDEFGGVVSFEVAGDGAEARAFVESLELFTLAVSLGSVESLVEHTASMSASYVPEAERRAAGITDSLVRAPVGIEDPADLLADLDRALSLL